MLGTAETVIEFLVFATQLLWFHDVKAQEPISELESVLQRRDHLLVDAEADDERIDNRFDDRRRVFIELDMIPQVARFPIDPRTPVPVDANLLEEVFVVLAINL